MPTRTKLRPWIDALAFIAATLVVNAIIFGLGWNDASPTSNRLSPPGEVIGAVWVVLLALLGFAHGALRGVGQPATLARWMVVALLVLCLTYPFYTDGLSSPTAGLVGNLVVLGFAACTAIAAAPWHRGAAISLVPMLLWIGYANAIVGGELG